MEGKNVIRPRIVSSKNAKRSCGHPFQPTYDIAIVDEQGNLKVTSYCAYCIVEKLGLSPCAKCIIPKGMKDPSQIKWLFNK